MKPLIVLNSVFLAVLLCSRFFGFWNFEFAGIAAMSAMLVFTALGHFIFPKGMEMMLPEYVPSKGFVVFFSGLMEVAFAICLLFPSIREVTAIALMVFFVFALPVNISAAKRRVDFEKANYTGKGINYLWIRVPMQAFFLLWVWFFGIYLSK